MYFSTGSVVTVIRVEGYNYVIPHATEADLRTIVKKLTASGFSNSVHKTEVTVKFDITDKLAQFDAVPKLPAQGVLALSDNFVARESKELLEIIGAVIRLEAPVLVKELSLVSFDDGIVAVENPGSNEVVSKATGYIEGETFVCEFGVLPFKGGK